MVLPCDYHAIMIRYLQRYSTEFHFCEMPLTITGRAHNLYSRSDITIVVIQYGFSPLAISVYVSLPLFQIFRLQTIFFPFISVQSFFSFCIFRYEKINQMCKAWKTLTLSLKKQYLGSLPSCQIYSSLS